MSAIAITLLAFLNPALAAPALDKIKLPRGFKIEVFNGSVPEARSMALSPGGVLYVGTRKKGKVYAIQGRTVHTVASNLNMPNGVAFRNGDLFIAEVSRIWRIPSIEKNLAAPPKPVLVTDQFPSDEHHGWKFIRFSPDGEWLYVPVGAPCNVCDHPENPKYASIMRMKPDGTGLEVFAHGIRNTVGFDWHPKTKVLWFTDNGRDMLGDDIPDDELNRAPRKGMHFGFPYCHGDGVPDPEFGGKKPCTAFEPPAAALGAHVAALGMRFYTGTQFPKRYQNQVFIAEHGSWNRSEKSGYRVVMAKLDGGKVTGTETFAEGWKQGESVWGRPVDLEVLPDGSLLVSDDQAGAIYRISYGKKR